MSFCCISKWNWSDEYSISGRIQNAEKGEKERGFLREGVGGLGTKEGGCNEKEREERRLEEEGVRKTTHAGQTVCKTVAEEECVKVCHHLRTVYRSTVSEGLSLQQVTATIWYHQPVSTSPAGS